MTNKEAIETLRYIKFYKADKDSVEPYALDLAIKALEENDRLKSDIDGLNNQMDDLCENLVWYINERNRLLANKRLQDNQISSITELCKLEEAHNELDRNE